MTFYSVCNLIAMLTLQQPCQTSDGEQGSCMPVVKCPLSAHSDTYCEIGSVDGVCCLPLQEGGEVGKERFKLWKCASQPYMAY